MRSLVLAAVLLGACSTTREAPPRSQPPADGAIVARDRCPIPADPAGFQQAVTRYYEADIVKAGLEATLRARPLSTVITDAEWQRYATAVESRRCEKITYLSEGLRVAGFIVRPAQPGPRPVLFWVRGGSADFGRIEPVTLLNLLAFADAGFVVVATQYRGADGGEGADEMGGRDVADVLNLLPVARTVPGADVDRLYLIGHSRGAIGTVLALTSGLPARAVAFRGGVYDAHAMVVDRPEMDARFATLVPGYATSRTEALDRRSAMVHVPRLRTPMLILHGRDDWRVRVSQAEAFAAKLAANGIPHKLVVYDGDEHQLVFHRSDWIGEAVRWFDAHGAGLGASAGR